ncbi:peptide-methionine (S)-S-oxide reductase MsrA [Algiphilus sp. W345]|uniref:Peptide methionine sulfoxide reductase MsrA n=1 Tax=Banduia mediterranea TaxID=3075609 RepID=A0ABU2WGF2_9GAMM|nr:peptide-methionine (S)-S-oxide reductase MsrA [Algiphilus sp. W345]MDT0496958.1 peptide-methionine (S)-S-oxide reductase MsrA [Algiphilus sp. W345]
MNLRPGRARRFAGIALASLAMTLMAVPGIAKEATATAIFAGGCFWCTESDFEKLDGVVEAVSGYIGGDVRNPDYKQVSAGATGHAEAVRVSYHPDEIRYSELVQHFWRTIDPTVKDQQFCDHGRQYRSAIFYEDAEQKQIAEDSLKALQASGRFERIETEISQAGPFYEAEDHHQDYYKKNPVRYKFYRWNCGRDQRLEEIWGEP